jgi:transposase
MPTLLNLYGFKFFFYANDVFMDIKQSFSRRLREALLDKWPGDRQQAIWAKQLGVSAPTLSEWLNGLKMPGMEKFIEICLVLDVCVEWLATGKGDKKHKESQKIEPKLTEEQKKILKEIIAVICD